MKIKNLNSIFILGGLAFIGILALQIYWIGFAWHVKTRDFEQRVNFSLRKVAQQMADQSGFELPKTDLIKQLSQNEFLVNYNYEIQLDILEDFLLRELDVVEPGIKFEYAVYDCFTNDLVYGDCCAVERHIKERIKQKLPQLDEFTYYFIVRFPNKNEYLLTNLKFFFVLGIFTIIVGFTYLYALKVLYRQKKLSELQKDFVDNMTHEFKTPLTSIKLASNVLLENKEITENTKLKKYSEIILQQSEKLTSHIERLLDLIRSDKTFNLKKESIDLVSLINDLNSETLQKSPTSDLDMSFDHPDRPVLISADRYHFYNVMQNLYDNAIKYNDKEQKQIKITIEDHSNEIILSVKDNGIGIRAEYLNYIFNKFFRVQKGNIHTVKGFGLGLYYVKNIIDLHGWKIFVESKENEFTTFKIKMKKNENGDQ
ncbi:MAG: HAMP domain-containing histidine kinase [Saprospiraceae bacterium]|nr:HAMP domain-containing histidine kinase [Saprospiraceae bacterium]